MLEPRQSGNLTFRPDHGPYGEWSGATGCKPHLRTVCRPYVGNWHGAPEKMAPNIIKSNLAWPVLLSGCQQVLAVPM